MIDFLPYYFLLLLVYFFLKYKERKSLYLVMGLLTLFSACRFNVGHDYPSYFNATLDLVYSDWERFEPIPKFITLLAYNMGSPFVFFFITSILINVVMIKSIQRYSSSIYISTLSYVCLPFFYIENLCIVRQAMALSFILYGICSFIYERSYINMIIAIVLAVSCHSSALICILLFLPFHIIKWNYQFVFLVGSILVGTGIQSYLQNINISLLFGSDYYSSYITETDVAEGNKMLLVYGVLAVVNIFSLKKYQKKEFINVYKCMSIVNMGFCLLFLLNFNHMLSFRISRYFTILLIITIPYYRILIFKGIDYKRLVFICLFVLFSLELIISQMAYNGGKGSKSYIPYQFYFFENTGKKL